MLGGALGAWREVGGVSRWCLWLEKEKHDCGSTGAKCHIMLCWSHLTSASDERQTTSVDTKETCKSTIHPTRKIPREIEGCEAKGIAGVPKDSDVLRSR